MRHEIGHVIGLFHEQSREDRDDWVKINYENTDKDRQFKKYSDDLWLWWGSRSGQDLGPYDFDSIMHYSSTAFSNNGKPTITRLNDCGMVGTIDTCQIFRGQRDALSLNDRRYIHELYCPLVEWTSVWPGEKQPRCDNYLPAPEGPLVRIAVKDAYGNADKCLDVANMSITPQAAVNQFGCHLRDNQLWTIQPDLNGGSGFYIRARHSGMCLDVPGWSRGDVGLQQYPCNGGSHQRFRLIALRDPSGGSLRRHGEFFIKAVHSGKCLGVDLDDRLIQTDCTSREVRLFSVEVRGFATSTVRLMNTSTRECLDVPGPVTYEHPLQDYSCNGGDNQRWRPVRLANEAWAFRVEHHADGCLGATGFVWQDGSVFQRSCGSVSNRPIEVGFYLHMMADGTFQLRTAGSVRRCVDDPNSGPYLITSSCTDRVSRAARWSFVN